MLVTGEEEAVDREELFVLEYCKLLHKRNAAIAAGYDEKDAANTASKLLRKTYIQRMIREEFDKRATELRIDGKHLVMQAYKSMIRAAEQGDEKAVQGAIKLMGQLLGCFEEHNKQKAGSKPPEAINAILKANGIDLDYIASPPRVLVEAKEQNNGSASGSVGGG